MTKFIAGLLIGMALAAGGGAVAQVYARVTTNGILKGYIVQDKRGREVCRDPFVQNQFRGLESYITCE